MISEAMLKKEICLKFSTNLELSVPFESAKTQLLDDPWVMPTLTTFLKLMVLKQLLLKNLAEKALETLNHAPIKVNITFEI